MLRSCSWAALLGLLATAGTTQAQPAATFAPIATFSTGPGSLPYGLAVADVNGDGKPDLLTANYSSHTVGVLLGTGTGSFDTVSLFSLGTSSYPYSIAVADVNADGKPDLLTTNTNSNTAGVLLGTGTGSFGPAATYSTGTQPTGIAVADVNADGKPDLLTANSISNTAGVLLGTGNGSFGPMTTFLVDRNPTSIAVADINADGQLDFLTTNQGTGLIEVMLGNGTGSFSTMQLLSTGPNSSPSKLVVADVNADGRPDLLAVKANNNAVAVLLSTGVGSFGPVASYNTDGNTSALAVADINGDGKPDLVTANPGTNTVGVLLGTGTGTFGTVTTLTIGASHNPYSIAVADVNADGRPDIITTNLSSNTVGVLLNAGTYTPLAAAAGLGAVTVTLHPNPAHGRVQVAVPAVAGAATVQATLLDGLGRVVQSRSAALPADGTTLTLDVAGLAAGVYTLRLAAGASVLARRVAIQ